jgi:hypothetical protein
MQLFSVLHLIQPPAFLPETPNLKNANERTKTESISSFQHRVKHTPQRVPHALASADDHDSAASWRSLKAEFAENFRFDPVERQNLIAWLDANARKTDAEPASTRPELQPLLPGLLPVFSVSALL